MSRPGVTYLEVAEAAHYLTGQGKIPTIEQIRQLLGTGSSTTLANHLRRWKTTQNKSSKAAKQNLPEALFAVVKGLWEKILAEAEERTTTMEKPYQEKINTLTAELQKYKKNNQRWQQLHNLWAEEKNKWRQEKLTAENRAKQLEQDYAALAEKQAILLEQLQEKQQRISELNRLHHQAQANLEHFHASVRTQRLMEQQRHEKEKKELQAQIRELNSKRSKNQTVKLEKQHQSLQKACALLEKRIKDLKTLKFID